MLNGIHQSAIVLVRCVLGSSPAAAILESEKTLGTRLFFARPSLYVTLDVQFLRQLSRHRLWAPDQH